MHAVLPKLKLVLGCLLLIGFLQLAVSRLPVDDPYTRVVLFRGAGLEFDLLKVADYGTALGMRAPPAGIRWAAYALTLLYFFAALSVVSKKYKVQTLLLSALTAAAIAGGLERTIRGYQWLNFQFRFGAFRFPAFNVYHAVVGLGFSVLLVLLVLRFFDLLPSAKRREETAGGSGRIYDPLLEKRRWLVALLWFNATVACLLSFVSLPTPEEFLEAAIPTSQVTASPTDPETTGILAFVAETAAEQARAQHRMLAVAVVALFAIVAISFRLLPYILVLRLIPKRPVDILFLRAFGADRRGWRSARQLRRMLRPKVRLTGVVDPRASRSVWYLYYWLTMPLVFGIGDQARVNVLRHNVFLDGDWKVGIRSAFSAVRVAVFDCRALTPNLAWEIEVGLERLGAGRSLFLVGGAVSQKKLLDILRGQGVSQGALAQLASPQLFQLSELNLLADRVRKVCELPAS